MKILKILTILGVIAVGGVVMAENSDIEVPFLKSDCPYACCLKNKDYRTKACTDPTYKCVEDQCAKCGNDEKEAGENCKTCSQDAPCEKNQVCSNLGECVILGTDENCVRVGHSCNKYEECIKNKCLQKSCPYECCNRTTYKIKRCIGKYNKCDEKEHRCVNRAADAVGNTWDDINEQIYDDTKTLKEGIDTVEKSLKTLKDLW